MPIEWNSVTWYSKALAVVLFVGVAVGSFMLGREYQRVIDMLIEESTIVQEDAPITKREPVLVRLAKNASYDIDGETVALVNGVSHAENPLSVGVMPTRYFGNEAMGDFNNDGKEDVVMVLLQQGNGSGAFFYAAALVSDENGYHGTNAVFIGDRIAPQSTDIRDGKANVNYADRGPKEPMATPPSIGKTLTLIIKDGKLVKQ